MSTSFFPSKDYRRQPDPTPFEPSDLVIRVAQPKDLAELVEVLSSSFHSRTGMMRWFFPLLRMGLYEDLRQRLRSPLSSDYVCLAAVLSATHHYSYVVGTVEVALRPAYPFQIRSSPYPYLSNLAVQLEYRRRGVAQKLLQTCEEFVLDRGFHDLYLHVLDDNVAAKQLYFKAGYRLKQADPLWCHWLLKQPRRVLLHKKLTQSDISSLA